MYIGHSILLEGVNRGLSFSDSEFQTPSVITGDTERPDIVIIKEKECFILELTVGFETNIRKNSERKQKKYVDLVKRLEKDYNVKYFDLSMGAIGTIGTESKGIRNMFEKLDLSKEDCDYLLRKIIIFQGQQSQIPGHS